MLFSCYSQFSQFINSCDSFVDQYSYIKINTSSERKSSPYQSAFAYVLVAQKNRLTETVLLSTYNIIIIFWLRNKKTNFSIKPLIYFIIEEYLAAICVTNTSLRWIMMYPFVPSFRRYNIYRTYLIRHDNNRKL